MASSWNRRIAESDLGPGTPSGNIWLRRAVEKTAVDVSAVTGSWRKKLFAALGGDLTTASGSWLKNLARLLSAEGESGPRARNIAISIEENGVPSQSPIFLQDDTLTRIATTGNLRCVEDFR